MALGNVIIKDVDGNLPYAASASNEKITGLCSTYRDSPTFLPPVTGKATR